MEEGKTALKRMAVYYLLLAINIIPCANVIPDRFPTRNLSEVWLLTLSVCLVLYYARRVSPAGGISVMMRLISWMGLFLILLRGIKYSAFAEVGALARHTWYFYYAPMLLIPLFLFYIALFVSSARPAQWIWYAALVITVGLIALILTNDLHQQAFAFQPGFSDWDGEYSHGWLFYAATFWQYALYFAAILLLVIKCRVGSAKKKAWIILIPFAIGIALNLMILAGKMPWHLIEFPEAQILMSAAVLECCMQLGLIPTNTDHGKLFRQFSIAAQITDLRGTPVYASRSALPLTEEQFAAESGARIGKHIVLHKMRIPGGFGFWQDDLAELDRLNEALAEAGKELAQEVELIRLRNELKEKQTKIEQRTLVYDAIASRTQRQSQAISDLAKTARRSSDPVRKETARRRVTLLGAYIKRYANLTLLSRECAEIEAGELGLSFSEVLRYLNYCGIPGEIIRSAEDAVPAGAALAVFEAFETLLETNLETLRGVFINFSENALKMTFENLVSPLDGKETERLSAAGVGIEFQNEDDIAYLCFAMPKGGAAE